MIRPDGFRGAAFNDAKEGNAKRDGGARRRISRRLDVAEDWAFVHQVHGAEVIEARGPGLLGEADAIFTTVPGLPIGIATADCLPIVVEGPGVVAVIHAGWRGLAGGVISETLRRVRGEGLDVERAAIGPGIGPCCYEVGADVADRFSDHRSTTTWGATSVDLAGAAEQHLAGLDVWRSTDCTMCGEGFHSYRRDLTEARQVAVGWLPRN